jgi:two-component system cell cycle response regulator
MSDRRVLLAENDPEHARRLQEMLEILHYDVELASTGLAALKRLQDADTPEMALLSESLSPISGIEIGLELRRSVRRRELWLMLMSDTPSADQVAMATEAGFDELLVKPVDLQELRMRIRTGERVQSVYRELHDSANAVDFYSTHDPLTATWRREAMLDFLLKETDRVQRIHTTMSVALLQVDGFSEVNTRYGFKVGDKLLQLLVSRLRQQLRSYDLIGRYAGDEFLFAFPGCTGKDAEMKAKRICEVVARRPFNIADHVVSIMACVGVAESLGRSPLIVLREAEQALSLARHVGPNTVHYFGEASQPANFLREVLRRLPASDEPRRFRNSH